MGSKQSLLRMHVAKHLKNQVVVHWLQHLDHSQVDTANAATLSKHTFCQSTRGFSDCVLVQGLHC